MRRGSQTALMAALLLLKLPRGWTQNAPAASAQNTQQSLPTIRSNTTLVLVPTLVLAPEGALSPPLTAQDFTVLDNGVSQRVSLDETTRQPLAVVVVLQTGGAAPRQFANYAKLGTMLAAIATQPEDRVALVNFDSQPEDWWGFTGNIDEMQEAWTKPKSGDDGAAIFDAVNFGIDLLEKRPPTMRRILILVSQTRDVGSTLHGDAVARRLGESNVTIYSMGFSVEKTWLKDQFTKPRHANKPYQMSPALPAVSGTFDLGTPLGMALKAMQTNAAQEISAMSGGEYFAFGDRKQLEENLGTVANHIPNRYMLSFSPGSAAAGLHALQVSIPAHTELQVLARRNYWAGAPAK